MATSERANADPSSTPYLLTKQEQAFINGVINPKFVEIGHTFNMEVDKLRKSLEQALMSEFASVRVEIKSEVAQLQDTMRSQTAALRSELMTLTDDKMATFFLKRFLLLLGPNLLC